MNKRFYYNESQNVLNRLFRFYLCDGILFLLAKMKIYSFLSIRNVLLLMYNFFLLLFFSKNVVLLFVHIIMTFIMRNASLNRFIYHKCNDNGNSKINTNNHQQNAIVKLSTSKVFAVLLLFYWCTLWYSLVFHPQFELLVRLNEECLCSISVYPNSLFCCCNFNL